MFRYRIPSLRPLPEDLCWRLLPPEKIHQPQSGLNPQTLGLKASTVYLRPIFFKYNELGCNLTWDEGTWLAQDCDMLTYKLITNSKVSSSTYATLQSDSIMIYTLIKWFQQHLFCTLKTFLYSLYLNIISLRVMCARLETQGLWVLIQLWLMDFYKR